MARTFANPTVTRALDAVMFMTPVGLPSTLFKQELEDRLMNECQFNVGMIFDRRHDVLQIRSWEQSQFSLQLKRGTPSGSDSKG